MKRATHILLGAAVALPIAAPLSPALAAGAVWLGMVGGGFPDWVDLRSDFRGRLKHRGASHSVLTGAVLAVGLYLMLTLVLPRFVALGMNQTQIRTLVLTFAAGFLSHIVADACTHAGVRPFLPLSTVRWWLLPKTLRGRSTGAIDTIARWLAITLLILGLMRYLQLHGVWL